MPATPIEPFCPSCEKYHVELKVLRTLSQTFIDGGGKGGKFGGVTEIFAVTCPETKEELVLVKTSWSGSKSGTDYKLFRSEDYDRMEKEAIAKYFEEREKQAKKDKES